MMNRKVMAYLQVIKMAALGAPIRNLERAQRSPDTTTVGAPAPPEARQQTSSQPPRAGSSPESRHRKTSRKQNSASRTMLVATLKIADADPRFAPAPSPRAAYGQRAPVVGQSAKVDDAACAGAGRG